jgi:8-oxo-dGTP diphosphatase
MTTKLNSETAKKSKKAKPWLGMLLFVISIILMVITGPIGLIYGLFYTLFTKSIRGVGEYCMQIADSIDQLGNVVMQHLLNDIWIKPTGYKFGNRDETISSVLGKNERDKTLSRFGQWIVDILNALDQNHTLNSIDYHIDPAEDDVDTENEHITY